MASIVNQNSAAQSTDGNQDEQSANADQEPAIGADQQSHNDARAFDASAETWIGVDEISDVIVFTGGQHRQIFLAYGENVRTLDGERFLKLDFYKCREQRRFFALTKWIDNRAPSSADKSTTFSEYLYFLTELRRLASEKIVMAVCADADEFADPSTFISDMRKRRKLTAFIDAHHITDRAIDVEIPPSENMPKHTIRMISNVNGLSKVLEVGLSKDTLCFLSYAVHESPPSLVEGSLPAKRLRAKDTEERKSFDDMPNVSYVHSKGKIIATGTKTRKCEKTPRKIKRSTPVPDDAPISVVHDIAKGLCVSVQNLMDASTNDSGIQDNDDT